MHADQDKRLLLSGLRNVLETVDRAESYKCALLDISDHPQTKTVYIQSNNLVECDVLTLF